MPAFQAFALCFLGNASFSFLLTFPHHFPGLFPQVLLWFWFFPPFAASQQCPLNIQELLMCLLESSSFISRNLFLVFRNSQCLLAMNLTSYVLWISLCSLRNLLSRQVSALCFIGIYIACSRKFSWCFQGIPLCLLEIFSVLPRYFLLQIQVIYPLLSKTLYTYFGEILHRFLRNKTFSS